MEREMKQFFSGISLRVLVAATAIAMFVSVQAQVPARLAPPVGNVEVKRAYAEGVQMYVSVENPALPGTYMWKFVAPSAILTNKGGHVMGTHYAGPTWHSNNTASNSSVKGTRIDGLTVDPTAIDWLLLKGRDWTGHGMFSKVTYIQRIDTVGGLAPFWNPPVAGMQIGVFYRATYVFFEAAS
jgi:hypothetical protein